MRISEIQYRNDALDKLTRLGLAHIFLEIENVIFSTYSPEESTDDVCGLLSASMGKMPDWSRSEIAGMDWIKSFKYRKTLIASIGLKICIPDIVGLGAFMECLKSGLVDVGIIIVLERTESPESRDLLRLELEDHLSDFKEMPYIILYTETDSHVFS